MESSWTSNQPVHLELAGIFLTTRPPGKPHGSSDKQKCFKFIVKFINLILAFRLGTWGYYLRQSVLLWGPHCLPSLGAHWGLTPSSWLLLEPDVPLVDPRGGCPSSSSGMTAGYLWIVDFSTDFLTQHFLCWDWRPSTTSQSLSTQHWTLLCGDWPQNELPSLEPNCPPPQCQHHQKCS